MVFIVGHRGARNLWPENSLDGFERTRALGIEGVEFDVHLSRDGELVVIHDPTLERTTEGQGPVADRTAAELAATKLRDGGGAGVPTLDRGARRLRRHATSSCTSRSRPTPSAIAIAGWSSGWSTSSPNASCSDTAILTCFAPKALEIVRGIAPRQRVLASVNQRSADAMGGLDGGARPLRGDRGLPGRRREGAAGRKARLLPRAPRPRTGSAPGCPTSRRTSPTGWRSRCGRSPPTARTSRWSSVAGFCRPNYTAIEFEPSPFRVAINQILQGGRHEAVGCRGYGFVCRRLVRAGRRPRSQAVRQAAPDGGLQDLRRRREGRGRGRLHALFDRSRAGPGQAAGRLQQGLPQDQDQATSACRPARSTPRCCRSARPSPTWSTSSRSPTWA